MSGLVRPGQARFTLGIHLFLGCSMMEMVVDASLRNALDPVFSTHPRGSEMASRNLVDFFPPFADLLVKPLHHSLFST